VATLWTPIWSGSNIVTAIAAQAHARPKPSLEGSNAQYECRQRCRKAQQPKWDVNAQAYDIKCCVYSGRTKSVKLLEWEPYRFGIANRIMPAKDGEDRVPFIVLSLVLKSFSQYFATAK